MMTCHLRYIQTARRILHMAAEGKVSDGWQKTQRAHLNLSKPLKHIRDAEAGNYRVVPS